MFGWDEKGGGEVLHHKALVKFWAYDSLTSETDANPPSGIFTNISFSVLS